MVDTSGKNIAGLLSIFDLLALLYPPLVRHRFRGIIGVEVSNSDVTFESISDDVGVNNGDTITGFDSSIVASGRKERFPPFSDSEPKKNKNSINYTM